MSLLYVNLLRYRNRRYLWVACGLLLVTTAIYFSQDASLPPNGGTWQGYTLGTIGALLIVWLAWFGIRKRSYNNQRGTLEGWVSAHVYLGLAVAIIATLHAGFQLGLNVHTLAWALMMLVITSGAYGLFAYMRYPRTIAHNRANKSFNEWLAELDNVDKKITAASQRCDPFVQEVVSSALDRTNIGGGLWRHLSMRDYSTVDMPGDSGTTLLRNPNQQAVIDFLVAKIPDTTKVGEVDHLQSLLTHFGRRADILQRLRRELGLSARLKVWLSFHIPLTIALLAALVAHIVSVFFYW